MLHQPGQFIHEPEVRKIPTRGRVVRPECLVRDGRKIAGPAATAHVDFAVPYPDRPERRSVPRPIMNAS